MHGFPTDPAMLKKRLPGPILTVLEDPNSESLCVVLSKIPFDAVTSEILTHPN